MLYLSTCVGFGYGLMWGLFPGTRSLPGKSSNPSQLISSVTTHWPTNINVVPIDYAFRPRLRDRLTLRRLTLRRNPWTFGDTVFHSVCRYSCQHSHFRYLQDASRLSLHRLTERSATGGLAARDRQNPEVRSQKPEKKRAKRAPHFLTSDFWFLASADLAQRDRHPKLRLVA